VRYKTPKSKILKIALGLFSSKGYSETKMAEIARTAGISVGALYLRYRSKEEICLELINEQRKGFDELTKDITAMNHNPLNALRSYITLNLDYSFKRKQLISMLMREHKLAFLKPMRKSFFKDQKKIIKDILVEGVKHGIFRAVNYEDTALMIFASIRGAILFKLSFEIGSVKRLSDSLFTLISNGIRKDVP
jgi:AcrR family transcriptional regulator